jgi:hypothetical protein
MSLLNTKERWVTSTGTIVSDREFCYYLIFGRREDGRRRIQLEILGLTLVDSFLACRKLMVCWQEEDDEESIFLKFVAVLLPQIDSRGRDDLFREPDEAHGAQCHMIRLGNKRTIDGAHREELRAVQMRCTSCSKRNKKNDLRGRAPLTAWGCSVHHTVYACKHKTCWDEHLSEVRREREREEMI